MKIEWEKLLIFVAIPLAVGTIAGLLIRGSLPLYASVQKPALAPPAWLFPIVWTLLYALMGFSSYLIFQSDSPEKTKALAIYALQLTVNFIWPLIFFNAQNFLLAFVILLLLWLLVLIMIFCFYKIDPLAASLQIPYLLWLTFAVYLNLSVYLMNS